MRKRFRQGFVKCTHSTGYHSGFELLQNFGNFAAGSIVTGDG